MDVSLGDLLKTMKDKGAGWVTRRDAIENLGKQAHRLVAALLDCQKDDDIDIKIAAAHSLEPLHVLLSTRGSQRKQFTLRDLAFACEKHGQRIVETYKSGFVVTVKLDSSRSHRVYLMPHKLAGERSIIRIFTLCGEATPDRYEWALHENSKLTHGAFSLISFNGEKYLAIMNNVIKEEATPEMIKRAVKEMAYYGDWLEAKLKGKDEL